MTRNEALDLLKQYSALRDTEQPPGLWHALSAIERFPADGSERKAMRWLGYVQGYVVAAGLCTLEDVKRHSRTGVVDV